MNAPFDSGLQLERTLLAWRRTWLALGVGVAVAVRYGNSLLPPTSFWLGLFGLGAITVAYLASANRYRSANRILLSVPSSLPTGGRAITAVTLISFGLCASAAIFILTGAQGP